jgi:hypothetical protein
MELKSQSNCVFDFTINKKQQTFFEEVLMAIAGKSLNRYFFYGGAVRGGKTAVCITILILLARKYPNSRWYIMRDSFTTLEATTIPSFEKFLPESSVSIKKYNRNRANYYVEFTNGSTIHFASESLNQDKELDWMLGLEVNGFMLEQIESLSEKCWQKALERVGSWYLPDMPPAIILSTFNPTQKWPKKMIYEPYIEGTLKAPYYFLQALPNDNPLVTADQWSGWSQMDDISYKRFIEGDWDAFAVDKPFVYKYEPAKHDGFPVYDPNYEVRLSFDFNKDPITAIAVQYIDEEIRVLKSYKIKNSNTYELCEHILVDYPDSIFIITGDATGKAGNALVRDNINHYTIIKNELLLTNAQIRVPTVNPPIEKNRVVVNSLIQHKKFTVHKELAKDLIFDMRYVQMDSDNKIIKDRSSEAAKADLLDCLRYYLNVFHAHELKWLNQKQHE